MPANDVTQATNDKQQGEQPMLGKIGEHPPEIGKDEDLLADAGYFGEANVNASAAAGIEPVIATGRIFRSVRPPSLVHRSRMSDCKPKRQIRLQRHFAGALEGIFKVAIASSFM